MSRQICHGAYRSRNDLFSKLYKSLVRPILEYCSPVWSAHLKKDIATLEKVQRRASRFALGTNANRMSYEDRLKRLKWPTLEKRRTLSSLTECYKAVNGLNGINPHDFFNFADKYRPLRSNHRSTIPAQLNCYKLGGLGTTVMAVRHVSM